MQLPEFLQIPCLLMEDEHLNQLDWFVYALVHWYSKQSLRRCTLKNFEMSELLKCSPGSISNSIARLKEYGYIEVIGSFKNRTGLVPLVTYSVQKRQFVPSTNGTVGSVPSTDGTVPSTDGASRGYLPTPNNNNKEYIHIQENSTEVGSERKSGLDTYRSTGNSKSAITGIGKKDYTGKKVLSPLEEKRKIRTKKILDRLYFDYKINLFLTTQHQQKALIDILDNSNGAYTEEDIFDCINWMLENDFWKQTGFDLRSVKNQLPKYKMTKKTIIAPVVQKETAQEIQARWAKENEGKSRPFETEEYKRKKLENAERAKRVEAARAKQELLKKLKTENPEAVRSEA